MTKPKKKRRWKGLVSLDRGLGALPDTIASRLGERAITNASITAIERTEDGFVVQGVDRSWRAKQLVLGTPAEKTAEFIAPFSPDAAALLRGIESVSLVVLNLAFERGAIEHPLDGFGFLTPRNEPDFPLMGVLWADSAFPHHAPPDQHLLRVFIGGVRTPDAHTWSDDQLLETALSGLRPALGVSGDPTLVDICRYDVAIPQYYLGHRARIEQVTGLVHSVPNLFLTGNYLNGVSINDCVRVGKETADQVLANTPHQGAAS
jgi:oxygen-dependent protoporphyrinogen oxidase